MNYPLDPNELLRLRTIDELQVGRRIPDAAVDRITAHAVGRFRVPVCLATLIEADRQLILSRQGIDVTQTPRETSFCTYTILSPEVLVVSDATADARFKANPYVTGQPFIRFYAGAPLIYEERIRLGSLCLVDTRPRTFSRGERAELAMLAEHVVSILIRRAYGLPEPDLSAALAA
ncbi:MAG TPA: GAF domain-containing protein [Microvirga sp.]|jgi:GAF domain-containing protein|nr:GAF domain-containing protein [Microvirga sp.]